ncbi:tyrosine-protein phosphatase (plasmid) [Deinococcus sp. KNUC1210]|uniref:tyrosine-protein phosphatase n=1 Tax=Deinococcus sp. KNUC1210 TaxID=2917691 RepID=UPI001EEF9CFF|nr:tyrosine-protein phosphatase [Deinococcus sp. KNUC1210]ULH18008.1 tyrosine-protein phosphatase [Deinococcus sp. KNUC1210]
MEITSEQPLWEGSLNARWVLPGLIRSANLSFLTPAGRTQLLASGLSRIIDLRNRAERKIDPAPFAGTPSYVNLPLLPTGHQALDRAFQAAETNGSYYRAILEHSASHVVTILGAMHDAPPGSILVHCHVGKDRTGLLVALILELAGVRRSVIAADYAETDQHVQEVYAAMLARQVDPQKRLQLGAFLMSQEEDILNALDYLDRTWGGTAPYLEAFGLTREEQQRLITRLIEQPGRR